MINIKQGLDLPIDGQPVQTIYDGPPLRHVALLGSDTIGLRPTLRVSEGDAVKKGQPLFEDKKNPGVVFTAPASGQVVAIHRGERRVLQSVVIALEGDDQIPFPQYTASEIQHLSRDQAIATLLASGLWTALRTRPFSKVPQPNTVPRAIFVTAMDSQPLAADPCIVIAANEETFQQGLIVLSRLCQGKVHVCHAVDANLPRSSHDQIVFHAFAGPHPAGLVGTHIHFIEPVSLNKSVWHINYQDVIAMGYLFSRGEIYSDRVIALAGPQVQQPRLLRTCLGASLDELTAGQLKSGENRLISGSVLSGTQAIEPTAFLGRYHLQVSVLQEARESTFLGWLRPGAHVFSITGAVLGHFFTGKPFPFSTATHGSERAMVPIGNYERVMPLDILPTLLLRDLLVGDMESAQALGCLELDEEDLALCTFVCPSKYEYGPLLRSVLTHIEHEG